MGLGSSLGFGVEPIPNKSAPYMFVDLYKNT